MTARERAELTGLVSAGAIAARAALFVLAVAVVGWVSATLQAFGAQLVGSPLELPFWIAPTLAFATFLYVRAGRWTGGRELRNRVRRDLRRGELAHLRVRVVEALEAPEVEDEGPVIFVRTDDGVTLFFSGQELARHKERGFPWREFEVIEAPVSRHFFRLRPLSASFEAVETREPLTFAEAKTLGVLSASFGTLDVGLDELKTRR